MFGAIPTAGGRSLLPPEVSRLIDAGDTVAREDAWKAFLETHSRLLLHTARKQSADYDAAMDAYAYIVEQLRQDDFRRLRSYVPDQRSKFTTWLVIVARRLCLDRARERYGRASDSERARSARLVRRRLEDLLAEELDTPAASRRTSAEDPEMQLRTLELGGALATVVGRLPPRDQLLLKLRFDDGLTAREIARVMRFGSALQVYRRLGVVLADLRKALGDRGIEGPQA